MKLAHVLAIDKLEDTKSRAEPDKFNYFLCCYSDRGNAEAVRLDHISAISDTQGKSIKKMTGREPVCLLRALTFLANAIFKQLRSLNITASLGENAYVHLKTRSEREMHDDGETEERLESVGGEEEG